MPLNIFFSHSSRDQRWCEWLAAAAEALGIGTYLAEHDVRPGTQLADKVKRAIDSSSALVVLLTDNTENSAYVHQEVGYAIAHGKLVIPLVQPGVASEQLAMLQGVEFIPFDFEDPDKGRDDLSAALTRLAQQRKQERDTVIILACLALILLAVTRDS